MYEFPKAGKKAKVIPIPKTGDLSDVSNYRPITLLPTPGKILEKLVHNQLVNNLEEEELMTEFQFSFCKSRSTSHARTQLLNHVNHNSTPTVAQFIDLKKAFDCLQYPTLLEKLKTFKLGDVVVSWVKNYLANRMQTTVANGLSSHPPSKSNRGYPRDPSLAHSSIYSMPMTYPIQLKKLNLLFMPMILSS